MRLSNTFEGGTNNSSITTGNSGGTSGDAFSLVDTDGGSPVFTNAQVAHGTLSARLPKESGLQWGLSGNGDRYIRAYLRPVLHNTSGQTHTIRLELATPNVGAFWYAEIALTSTTATLTLQAWNNSGGAQVVVGTASTAPLTGQWIRVELRATNAASGTGEARLYNDPDASTPSATVTGNMSQTLEAWSYAQVYHYASNDGSGPDVWVDDLVVTDEGWPGSVVTDTPKTSTDTAGLVEAARIGQDRTDTATLTEASAIDAAVARTDQASLVEASTVGPTATDQAGLSEQAAIATALSAADTATLAEVSAPAPILDRTDTASLSETAALAPSVAGSDTAGLVEQTPVIDLTSSDTAGLVEQTPVIDETTGPATADTATLVELSGITADPAATDTADLTELSAVDVLRYGTETLTLAEASTLSLPTTDTAGLAETAAVVATLDLADTADLLELSDAVQPLTAFDVATLLEQAVVINLGRDVTAAGPPYIRWRASTPYT